MESQQNQSQVPPPPAPKPASSCRKKKSEGSSFVVDMREHVDEFFSASVDENKTFFKKTVEKNSVRVNEDESSLPLKTTVTE
ncbi:hypothetical protein MKX03_006151 [Papaver bracteatum]|nr:hypothetical protein MKX03_006151 [Papaver bracteatum]